MNERQQQKLTILYLRLSKDDLQQTESNSITNQRRLLEEYAERNGFTPYISEADDGYSGTNFNRPGWQNLMARVETGEVGTIIVKSLDRMGRNYLQNGLLREQFKDAGIRLIAVNDGIDTFEHDDDFTPFREILAEYYARDTSKKIKSVLKNKGRDGKPLGSVPLYGFRKDPDDKNARLIDDEAAGVVRRMFRMTVDGLGPYQIAKIFMDEKIERPSYYLYRTGIVTSDGKCNHDLRYNWRGGTIMGMLQKREYMGDLVNFKSYKPYVRDNEQEFVEKLREASALHQRDMAKSHKRTIAKNEKRIAELDRLFIKTYEDNAVGKLSDERFNQMTSAYDDEQAQLKAQTSTLTAELEAFERDGENADRFLGLVRKYTQFDELTPAILHEFVDKVCVHEADKSSGERRQRVDVYLNFIGNFNIPGSEPEPLTPEEQAAEEKRLAEKRRKNEYMRTWRAQRKSTNK